jgi:hypothetical protein
MVEIVRDDLAAILKVESENQQRLALLDAPQRNPDDWALDVFLERSDPWEMFPLGSSTDEADPKPKPPPIVNVWFDEDTFDRRGNVVESQATTAIFHVDCYGYGRTRETDTGHEAGDRLAVFEAMRAARLVRNILMSAAYTYLGRQGTIAGRWLKSRKLIQPGGENGAVDNVVAVRLTFEVSFKEEAPQFEGQPLELIASSVLRAGDGRVLLQANYPHTP